MKKGKFSFKLKVSRAYYIQKGTEHSVNIPYLHFMQDGNVSLEGEDGIGTFSFSGKIHEDYLFLQKNYHGKHTVHYVGKLDKNHLHLYYDFDGDYAYLKSKVVNGESNAGIVFDAKLYNLFIEQNETKVFLFEDYNDKNRKLKGLGKIDNKVFKLILNKKLDDYGTLKTQCDGDQRKYKVRLSGNNILVEYHWCWKSSNSGIRLEFYQAIGECLS